ncbi:MAG: hypothetical protein GTO63_17940, partial [Anaerolineae bacterium]|nr:hypothetical protein [Anaerolineae bacterium]NIN96684.1 hypothetical protein [Anaerolineae bacterium]NIQ79694.1 hypothetical protein [Anaerolineae bacterium]
RPIQTFLLWPLHKRIVLVISLVVLLFVAAAVLTLRYISRPAWHIQMLLHSEARALEAGDQEKFFSLQDPANKAWLRHQRNEFNSQQWARERGEAWALEPVPKPKVVSVQQQGEEIWAEVVIRRESGTWRKVEFFRRVNDEWKHTGPNVQFWGSPRETRTTHLHWTYRERDEECIASLLNQGEEIYQRVCDDFGLLPAKGQVTIKVAYSWDGLYLPFYPAGPTLSLPSPLLIGMKEDSEPQTEQPLGALLVNYLAVQAVGGDVAKVTGARRAALDAIRHWETWEVSSQEREPYWEAPLLQAIEAGELLPLSEVWGEDEPESYTLAVSQSHTLIDYIVTKYGRQSIAALLAALSSSSSLEEALQKALGPGFTMAQFESGWLAFIWARYEVAGVPPAVTPAPKKTSTPAPTAPPTPPLPAIPLP